MRRGGPSSGPPLPGARSPTASATPAATIFLDWHPDCRQAGHGGGSERNVVEADDRELARHGDGALIRGVDQADREESVAATIALGGSARAPEGREGLLGASMLFATWRM